MGKENSEKYMRTKVIDWQARVSRDIDVIEVKPMSVDMSRTRLKPVFLESTDLSIVVPATCEEEAKKKAENIARHIVASGVWGLEIWDLPSFLSSIEKLL